MCIMFVYIVSQQQANGHRKLTRSSSMTPLTPPPLSAPVSATSHQLSDLLDAGVTSRSMTNMLSTTDTTPWTYSGGPAVACMDHAPLSPQSSIASSGSGSDTGGVHDDPSCIGDGSLNPFLDDSSGMKGKQH